MFPGNLPLVAYNTGESLLMGIVSSSRRNRAATENLRLDVANNRRPAMAGRVLRQSIGVVTNKGPNDEGEPDWNNYWVKIQRMVYNEDDDDIQFQEDTRPGVGGIVLAKNTAERKDQHGLRNDEKQYVEMRLVLFNAAVPVTRWLFHLAPPPIWICLGSSTQDGSNKRWQYDWTEYDWTNEGFGNTSAVSGGLTGHSSTRGYAYNSMEEGNGATGTFHNGVSSSNLTGSLTVKPFPSGTIVPAWQKWPEDSDKPFLVFTGANAIDGGCT